MFNQEAMLIVAIIAATALIIGALLTLIGGLFATSRSQRAAGQLEARKRAREKLEEIYLLLTQIRTWALTQTIIIAAKQDFAVVHTHEIPVLLSGEYVKDTECPVERLDMLVHLYAAFLAEDLNTYRRCIARLIAMKQVVYSRNPSQMLSDYSKELFGDQKIKDVAALPKHIASVLKQFDTVEDQMKKALEKSVQAPSEI